MHKSFCLLFLALISFTSFAQTKDPKHLKPIDAEGFNVTDEMLEANKNRVDIEDLNLEEFIFFKNTALKQTLVFELYTDNYRNNTFLFYNDTISYELLKMLFLPPKNKGKYPLKTIKDRKQVFQTITDQAHDINIEYFTSKKGIELGDHKEKILSIYPQEYKSESSESCNGNCQIYKWNFKTNLIDDSENRTVLNDKFDHNITMVFEDDKLIILVVHNEIP